MQQRLNRDPSGVVSSPLDINHDGVLAPRDALITTNHLNYQARSVTQPPTLINLQAVNQRCALDGEDDGDRWLDEEKLDLLLS
ncbi:hypothetical protein CA13_27010 [Planctomycetes bacterium CA13]|uniref:Dockerin type I repeat protein n=1 Tax=Novipirellula herctigrandis TaxID=2527986 RepID=A0A5C5Z245_9BACT|nr:hypothetical protein CA13_27010 [Planctomycetes bacterium CA13]